MSHSVEIWVLPKRYSHFTTRNRLYYGELRSRGTLFMHSNRLSDSFRSPP